MPQFHSIVTTRLVYTRCEMLITAILAGKKSISELDRVLNICAYNVMYAATSCSTCIVGSMMMAC